MTPDDMAAWGAARRAAEQCHILGMPVGDDSPAPDPTGDYLAENPTLRMLAAEARREARRLIEAGSLGTPGARAMRKRGAGYELTAAEQADAARELADLDRSMHRGR